MIFYVENFKKMKFKICSLWMVLARYFSSKAMNYMNFLLLFTPILNGRRYLSGLINMDFVMSSFDGDLK